MRVDQTALMTGWEVVIVSQRTKPFRLSSIKSLETPTTLASSLAGGSLGISRYGNLIITVSIVMVSQGSASGLMFVAM